MENLLFSFSYVLVLEDFKKSSDLMLNYPYNHRLYLSLLGKDM